MSFVCSLDITHFVLATQVYTCNEFNKKGMCYMFTQVICTNPPKAFVEDIFTNINYAFFFLLFFLGGGGVTNHLTYLSNI